MKRSKMVLLIAEMLVEPRSEDVMVQAHSILKRLEKNGMLPPPMYINNLPKIEGNKIVLEWEVEV